MPPRGARENNIKGPRQRVGPGHALTNPDDKLAALKSKWGRKLQKPIGHHEEHAQTAPTSIEYRTPDPETHGQGAHAIEGEHVEHSKVCPACKSPAHGNDTKCPWCGAAL